MKRLSWMMIATLTTIAGCSADDSVDERTGETGDAISAGTPCEASRGRGVVNRYQKALHDSIAFAEGTEGRGSDGYNIAFTHRQFSSCARHPNMNICSGSPCSTAAGRYQFLKRTWDTIARANNATTFQAENQELGAQYLITRVRRARVPADRPMTAAEFDNAMSRLSYEWASLPPGRYGQPSHSGTEMRRDYCRNAGC